MVRAVLVQERGWGFGFYDVDSRILIRIEGWKLTGAGRLHVLMFVGVLWVHGRNVTRDVLRAHARWAVNGLSLRFSGWFRLSERALWESKLVDVHSCHGVFHDDARTWSASRAISFIHLVHFRCFGLLKTCLMRFWDSQREKYSFSLFLWLQLTLGISLSLPTPSLICRPNTEIWGITLLPWSPPLCPADFCRWKLSLISLHSVYSVGAIIVVDILVHHIEPLSRHPMAHVSLIHCARKLFRSSIYLE